MENNLVSSLGARRETGPGAGLGTRESLFGRRWTQMNADERRFSGFIGRGNALAKRSLIKQNYGTGK